MGGRFFPHSLILALVIQLSLAFLMQPTASAGQDPVRSERTTYSDLVHRWQILLLKDATQLDGIIRSGRPTFLAFIDKSCGYCLSMVPVMEELQREYQGRLNIVTVDNERQDMPVRLLVKDYQVWAVPMFVVFDRQGHVYRKLFGPQSKERLTRLLGQVLEP